jgi:hypothetical protein
VTELELVRDSSDRRLYTLGDVGALRLLGWSARDADAKAGAGRWRFERPGLLGRRAVAIDETGGSVGSFDQHGLRRGGVLEWTGRTFELRAASTWRERYALADGESELVLLDTRGWSRTPVRITVQAEVEPGLLLFATYVVRTLAADAGATAAVVASTAATG